MSILVEFPQQYYTDFGSTAFAAFTPKPDFDLHNARAMMWMSQLAYETGQQATIDHAKALWGFDTIDKIILRDASVIKRVAFDTRGVLAERNDAIVIAFGGTDWAVWENLVTDFNVVPRQGTDTHPGFQAAADAALPLIKSAFLKGKPVFLTGHSLGAALAVLASFHAHTANTPPMAVYLFGCPRVGNSNFVTRYNAALGDVSYRLVHGHDVVPCVPPPDLAFHHIGRMLACASGGKFDPAAALAPLSGDDPQLGASLRTSLQQRFQGLLSGTILAPPGPGPLGQMFRLLPMPFRDHLQDRYLDALA